LSVKVAIIDKDARCLLVKRSQESKGNPGKWELPGGKVGSGEDFDRALIREVLEETGLSISLSRLICCCEHELAAHKIAYLIMEGQLKSGSVRLSDEHQDFAWVAKRDLPRIDLVAQLKEFALLMAAE
jgi:8-oxo-dGTP diphosphatase